MKKTLLSIKANSDQKELEFENKTELENMIDLLSSNLQKFEEENTQRVKLIAEKVLLAYDLP